MKFTKKLQLGLALAAASTLLLSGCSGGADGSTGSGEGSNGKIALAMSHMENEFTTTVAKAAKKEAKALGYELTVFDGKQDASTQVTQIEQAVSQGFDGILVEPVSTDAVSPGLTSANDAGVPIATIVQKAKDQDLAAAYIGGDEEAAGELQMTEALKSIDGEGEIGILYGPMGSDAQLARKDGYDAILKKNPDVTVKYDQTANWVTAEALKLVENWLSTSPNMKAIVAQNDGMAVGAAQAVKNAGKEGDISVFGIDATADGVSGIKEDSMQGTVSQDTPGIGKLGVETMAKIIKGDDVEKEVLTKAVWITKDNLDELD
jgi:inositol transport system substrate-binding protein